MDRTNACALAAIVFAATLVRTPVPARAADAASQGKTLVIPNTAIALPAGCGVKVRWVSPPVAPKTVEDSRWYSLRFAVDAKGRPWIGYASDSVSSPVRRYSIHLGLGYTSIACLDNGAFLAATSSDLCTIVPPKEFATSYDGVPTADLQPIAGLPAPNSVIYEGAGDCVYVVSPTPSGGSDVYLLRQEGAGIRGFVKIFSSEVAVAAVTGDANSAFVALPGVIVKVSVANGSASRLCAVPGSTDSMAYQPGVGLFFSAGSEIDYVGAHGCKQIMAAPDTLLTLRGGSLYILFKKSLGVLALDNIAGLKRIDRIVKETPADAADVKVTGVKFFESGAEAPDLSARTFATKFDKASSRYIFTQVDLHSKLTGKQSRKLTVNVTLYRDGSSDPQSSEDIGFNMSAEAPDVCGWCAFGAEEAGEVYPGAYTAKVSLNGTQVAEARFTVTGKPTAAQAVVNGDPAGLSKLLDAGADPNETVDGETTLLMLATMRQDAEMVKLLLAARANVNAKTADGETALTMQAGYWTDDATIARMLLDAGADVDAQGENGQTALHKAAYRCKQTVTELLLRSGARTDIKDKDGRTALCTVVGSFAGTETTSAAVVDALLSHGADVNALDSTGNPPLFEAIGRPNPAAVTALIQHGANVNAMVIPYKDAHESILAYAIARCGIYSSRKDWRDSYREIALSLQKAGADLNPGEFDAAWFPGVDKALDARHMSRLLEMSANAARRYEPESPYLRKAVLRGLLNAAARTISAAKSAADYAPAAELCDTAIERARRWGLLSTCPEVYFDAGLVRMRMGDAARASELLSQYLTTAPTGPSAARARELMGQMQK